MKAHICTCTYIHAEACMCTHRNMYITLAPTDTLLHLPYI